MPCLVFVDGKDWLIAPKGNDTTIEKCTYSSKTEKTSARSLTFSTAAGLVFEWARYSTMMKKTRQRRRCLMIMKSSLLFEILLKHQVFKKDICLIINAKLWVMVLVIVSFAPALLTNRVLT